MIIIIRTVVIYIVVMFALRLMGKKQIGELEPSELAVAIMISELATIPLSSNDVPLLNGIIPVLTLASVEIIVSIIILKSVRIRLFVTGTPCVIVEKGILKEDTLKKTRFTTDDLLEEMRNQGIANISEIQYALLETGGKVSFILNKKDSPVTLKDLNINSEDDGLPFPVLTKGVVLKRNLNIIGRDEAWLKKELSKKNITDYKSMLLVTANNKGIKFIQERGK